MKLFLLLICVINLLSANAAPAPWLVYKSKVDGQVMCAQTSPGSGWLLISGPYHDSHCEQLIVQ